MFVHGKCFGRTLYVKTRSGRWVHLKTLKQF